MNEGLGEEREEAILIDFKKTFITQEFAKLGDERRVFFCGGEGVFNFRTIVGAQLLFKIVFRTLLNGIKRLWHGGLHELHEEMEQADIPWFIHALYEGGVGIGAFGVSCKGLFANEFNGFIDNGFAIGFTA